MNIWDKITGNDITKECKIFEIRAKNLPSDYQEAWEKIKENIWQYSDFSGRNLMTIMDNILEILEETAIDGQSVQDALGDDIKGFCLAFICEDSSNSVRDKWRKKLNNNIAKKLNKYEYEMKIQDIIKGKKEWREHIKRVKSLPKDYQIVYKEIQKYLFKVGPIDLTESIDLLSGIVDFFEEGATLGKDVLEVTGKDISSFCDELIKDSKSYSDICQESIYKTKNKLKR